MADDYHVKKEVTKTNRKKLDRNAEYDRENRTIIACKTTKDKAAAFKMACESVSTKENPCNPNAVLLKAINDFMNREDIGGWELWLDKVEEKK